MHGYSFNVIGIGRSPDQNVKKINLKHALDLDRRGLLHRQFRLPPSKDTIAVPNNGYVILRFRADNPGLFLTLRSKNGVKTLNIICRILVVPLSLFVSCCDRYEYNYTRGDASGFTTGAA